MKLKKPNIKMHDGRDCMRSDVNDRDSDEEDCIESSSTEESENQE